MIRKAFTLRLKPGGLAEYIRRHDEIWAELVAEIEKSGIAEITIFENDPIIFLYSEIYDESAWDRLWNSEVHLRWAESTQSLMYFDENGIAESSPVREIYHLETGAQA
jgi:L-rhamnose mutarotase